MPRGVYNKKKQKMVFQQNGTPDTLQTAFSGKMLEISLCICKSVYQFSLLSGHNFPSLNPSISDKKNIQTLAKDSGKWVGIS